MFQIGKYLSTISRRIFSFKKQLTNFLNLFSWWDFKSFDGSAWSIWNKYFKREACALRWSGIRHIWVTFVRRNTRSHCWVTFTFPIFINILGFERNGRASDYFLFASRVYESRGEGKWRRVFHGVDDSFLVWCHRVQFHATSCTHLPDWHLCFCLSTPSTERTNAIWVREKMLLEYAHWWDIKHLSFLISIKLIH